MTSIRRLTNSCLLVATDDGTTILDPGFFTFESGEIELNSIGDVQRILITHEHPDHVNPEFVRWLVDRGSDVTVYSNDAVANLLADHDIAVMTDEPAGTSAQDVAHEMIPNGSTPPNRSWTIDGVLTHPGDSYQPTSTAPILALPLLVPWGSTTASVQFARRLAPRQVIPIHDFYLSASGRQFALAIAGPTLAQAGIELIPLDWGDSYTL